MACDIIMLDDHRYPWREIISLKTSRTTLQVYTNTLTGEVEIAQMNDEGESIRTSLDRTSVTKLTSALGGQTSRTA